MQNFFFVKCGNARVTANSVEQNPSCEPSGSLASEEVHRILSYPKIREPYSQHPSSCPYPEPDESNQRPCILWLEDPVLY
jgi:hypothetical protein